MASEELQFIIDLLREGGAISEAQGVDEMRARMEAMTGFTPLPEGTSSFPVDADGVPAEWVSGAGASPQRTVLYLHGGAYVIGSIDTHRALAARISEASGARCLVIGYRLAPENPFPAAVDDAARAYRWLLAGGADPACVAIAGDSAGGGLTVATLVALRDGGAALPAAAVCMSPWVDLEGLGESMTRCAELDPMVQREGLLQSAAMYLAGADPKTPLAAPLHAELSGLPPLLIQVGTAETLLDDSTRLAARARREGVDVSLETWDEMIHVFQAFAPGLPEANTAIERIGDFLRKRLG